MARTLTWLGVAVAVMSALGWLAHDAPSPALADEAIGEAEARLTFEQPVTRGDTVTLLVRLTADDGQPIARARVEFFVIPDFFGERPVSLQTAITNADGLASLKYVPTWDGAHKITAKFRGNADYQPGEATAVMTASGTATLPVSEGQSLHILRVWAAPAVTLGAVIVWLILAGVLIRVGWGISRASDRREAYTSSLPGTAVEKLLSGANR